MALAGGARSHGQHNPSTHQQQSPDDSSDECSMRMVDIRGLTAVMQALKFGGDQDCSIEITESFFRVHYEASSKTLQCSVTLTAELFNAYHCPPGVRHTFGLGLSTLLDMLNIFASAPSQQGLEMRYSGTHKELVCNMSEEVRGSEPGERSFDMTMYARLGATEIPSKRDLVDFWQGPNSSFSGPGSLFKEAVEDMEWPSNNVSIMMRRDPQQLVMASDGAPGTLSVDIPPDMLTGFQVADTLQLPRIDAQTQGDDDNTPDVSLTYKYKAMKAAFCSLPGGKGLDDVDTEVLMDSHGMIKVIHEVAIGVPTDRATSLGGPSYQQQPSMQHSGQQGWSAQGPARSQGGPKAVVIFLTCPCVAEDDDRD